MAETGNNLEISNNNISDSRIGIYLSSINNTATTYNGFTHVNDNNIDLSQPTSYFNGGKAHYGIWIQNCYKLLVNNNHLVRTTTDPLPAKLYGLLFKATRFMDVRDNIISNYGTGIRLVANCNTTDLRCNQLNDCTTGTYMQQASMTAQGSGTDPWDNTWDGIANNKVDGTLNLITSSGFLKWYYRGSGVTSYAPIPYNTSTLGFQFSPISSATGPSACSNYCGTCPFVINDINTLEKIINNQLTYDIYPDESRQLDKWYVYYVLNNILISETVQQYC